MIWIMAVMLAVGIFCGGRIDGDENNECVKAKAQYQNAASRVEWDENTPSPVGLLREDIHMRDQLYNEIGKTCQ